MTIGEKIKELRKKNDLTQEKLADYLCISYQAVSKWETGISSPDLSVIGSLTKLLHVSADELLGLNEDEPNKRRTELEAAYEKSWITGDLDERLKIVEAAVKEYPGDLKYLNWLASTTYYRAMENLDYGEEQDAEIEKSIKIHERVIEECTDTEVRCASLVGIIVSLSWLKRYDEAKKYVELYPEKKPPARDDLLWYCLTGEEQIKYQQNIIKKSFADFIWQLNIYEDKNASKIAEQVIKLMIPDGNYLNFHGYLFDSISNQALELAHKGQYDESVVMLEKAYYHAMNGIE